MALNGVNFHNNSAIGQLTLHVFELRPLRCSNSSGSIGKYAVPRLDVEFSFLVGDGGRCLTLKVGYAAYRYGLPDWTNQSAEHSSLGHIPRDIDWAALRCTQRGPRRK